MFASEGHRKVQNARSSNKEPTRDRTIWFKSWKRDQYLSPHVGVGMESNHQIFELTMNVEQG